MTVAEIFARGGPVVWVLGGYSLIALTIILERLAYLLLSPRLSPDFERELTAALRTRQTDSLRQRLRGPDGRLIGGLLDALHEGGQDLARVASRLGSAEVQRMERGFRTLGFLGNTAPLLGLFGTILGMIKAFMVIEQAGGKVDAQALAGGIWEAMITTGVGLAVSIPLLLLLHVLEGMADRRALAMQRCASIVLEQTAAADAVDSETVHHREGVVHAV